MQKYCNLFQQVDHASAVLWSSHLVGCRCHSHSQNSHPVFGMAASEIKIRYYTGYYSLLQRMQSWVFLELPFSKHIDKANTNHKFKSKVTPSAWRHVYRACKWGDSNCFNPIRLYEKSFAMIVPSSPTQCPQAFVNLEYGILTIMWNICTKKANFLCANPSQWYFLAASQMFWCKPRTQPSN